MAEQRALRSLIRQHDELVSAPQEAQAGPVEKDGKKRRMPGQGPTEPFHERLAELARRC